MGLIRYSTQISVYKSKLDEINKLKNIRDSISSDKKLLIKGLTDDEKVLPDQKKELKDQINNINIEKLDEKIEKCQNDFTKYFLSYLFSQLDIAEDYTKLSSKEKADIISNFDIDSVDSEGNYAVKSYWDYIELSEEEKTQIKNGNISPDIIFDFAEFIASSVLTVSKRYNRSEKYWHNFDVIYYKNDAITYQFGGKLNITAEDVESKKKSYLKYLKDIKKDNKQKQNRVDGGKLVVGKSELDFIHSYLVNLKKNIRNEPLREALDNLIYKIGEKNQAVGLDDDSVKEKDDELRAQLLKFNALCREKLLERENKWSSEDGFDIDEVGFVNSRIENYIWGQYGLHPYSGNSFRLGNDRESNLENLKNISDLFEKESGRDFLLCFTNAKDEKSAICVLNELYVSEKKLLDVLKIKNKDDYEQIGNSLKDYLCNGKYDGISRRSIRYVVKKSDDNLQYAGEEHFKQKYFLKSDYKSYIDSKAENVVRRLKDQIDQSKREYNIKDGIIRRAIYNSSEFNAFNKAVNMFNKLAEELKKKSHAPQKQDEFFSGSYEENKKKAIKLIDDALGEIETYIYKKRYAKLKKSDMADLLKDVTNTQVNKRMNDLLSKHGKDRYQYALSLYRKLKNEKAGLVMEKIKVEKPVDEDLKFINTFSDKVDCILKPTGYSCATLKEKALRPKTNKTNKTNKKVKKRIAFNDTAKINCYDKNSIILPDKSVELGK